MGDVVVAELQSWVVLICVDLNHISRLLTATSNGASTITRRRTRWGVKYLIHFIVIVIHLAGLHRSLDNLNCRKMPAAMATSGYTTLAMLGNNQPTTVGCQQHTFSVTDLTLLVGKGTRILSQEHRVTNTEIRGFISLQSKRLPIHSDNHAYLLWHGSGSIYMRSNATCVNAVVS